PSWWRRGASRGSCRRAPTTCSSRARGSRPATGRIWTATWERRWGPSGGIGCSLSAYALLVELDVYVRIRIARSGLVCSPRQRRSPSRTGSAALVLELGTDELESSRSEGREVRGGVAGAADARPVRGFAHGRDRATGQRRAPAQQGVGRLPMRRLRRRAVQL